MNHKIIVPTDFTKAASQAIKQAAAIAGKAGASLTLLHVLDDPSVSAEVVMEKMNREVEITVQKTGITCDAMVQEGDIFHTIPAAVCERDFDLMVIGTHGIQGIRQMIFGADIAKLIAKIPIPVLVVQEDSPLIETFSKIVLPVGSHDTFMHAVDAVLFIAAIYDVEVHLYSIYKPGTDWPMQMLQNIEDTRQKFQEKGVRMIRVKEEQNDHSPGYARQTLKYARTIGADTIWMMSVPSQDYHYMAKAYKETLLLNEFHLPVLCAGGGGCK
jgi:nucleotide-binding universal stress UspA family protein